MKGQAEVVVQSAAAYQSLLEDKETLDNLRSLACSYGCSLRVNIIRLIPSKQVYLQPSLVTRPDMEQSPAMSRLEIRPASAADVPALRELFREYAGSVGNDICFQTFEKEVASLPGAYCPPQGEILVAADAQTLAACVALRPLTRDICEMKRLYVRPAFRGTALGRTLAEHTLTLAATLGYTALRLDTLPEMAAAIALYRKLGFREIPRYADNPASALCFEKLLKSV